MDSVHLNASLDEMFEDLSIYYKRTIKQCRGTGRRHLHPYNLGPRKDGSSWGDCHTEH